VWGIFYAIGWFIASAIFMFYAVRDIIDSVAANMTNSESIIILWIAYYLLTIILVFVIPYFLATKNDAPSN